MTRFKPFHRSIFLSAIVVVFVYGNQIGQRQDLNCCRPFMLQVATTLPTLVFGSFLNSALSYLQCISAFWYIGNCYLSRVPGLPILVNLSTLESAYYFGDSLPVYFTFIFLEIHICRRSEIFLTQTLKLNDLLPTSFFIYTFFAKILSPRSAEHYSLGFEFISTAEPGRPLHKYFYIGNSQPLFIYFLSY